MKRSSCLVAILFLLVGCAATGRPDLPTFSYNQRSRNAAIVNRHPHYGDGQADGCIVEAQFALGLRAAAGDSLIGFVTDTKTKQPVLYATATLVSVGASAPTPVLLSPAGKFVFSRAQKVQRITIAAIGYRSLTVDIQPIGN